MVTSKKSDKIPYETSKVSNYLGQRQSTENSTTWNHDSATSFEMKELKTAEIPSTRSSISSRGTSPSKQISKTEENVTTDSETISTLTSFCNDVTVMGNTSPANTRNPSNGKINRTIPKQTQHVDEEANKLSDMKPFCDKTQSSTNNITDKGFSSLNTSPIPKISSSSAISTHSINSASLATTISNSKQKWYDRFSNIL